MAGIPDWLTRVVNQERAGRYGSGPAPASTRSVPISLRSVAVVGVTSTSTSWKTRSNAIRRLLRQISAAVKASVVCAMSASMRSRIPTP